MAACTTLSSPGKRVPAMQYDVYPLPVVGFRDLPPALQAALVKRASGQGGGGVLRAAEDFEHAESFEFLTRNDGQRVVRVNMPAQYIELSSSEDRMAVSQLTKLIDLKKKRKAPGGGAKGATKA